jgi:hypothetical protein
MKFKVLTMVLGAYLQKTASNDRSTCSALRKANAAKDAERWVVFLTFDNVPVQGVGRKPRLIAVQGL